MYNNKPYLSYRKLCTRVEDCVRQMCAASSLPSNPKYLFSSLLFPRVPSRILERKLGETGLSSFRYYFLFPFSFFFLLPISLFFLSLSSYIFSLFTVATVLAFIEVFDRALKSRS